MPPQGKHKRECSDDQPSTFPLNTSESEALVSPTRYGQSTISRASAQAKKDAGHAKGTDANASTSGTDEPVPSLHKREAWFVYRGSRVRVKHTTSHLSWKRIGSSSSAALACGCMPSGNKLPYDEVLSAWLIPQPQLISCMCPKENSLVVYSLRRPRSNPSNWKVQQHVLNAPSVEQAKEWVAVINAAVALRTNRPRNVLVFINPFSGSRRSRHTWQSHVMPVFLKARIRFTVIETTEQAHATKVVCNMRSEELSKYQGLVAIGGDGLFQELVMGLLQHRAANPDAPLSVQRMRLGHIPGGSTDAVAYSLYNSRSPETAALHVALGDRHPLDVARVDTLGGQHKYFVCQAAYGFLGDVMSMSEGMRALGPSRYDVAGAIRYLQLNSYRLSISYRPAQAPHLEAGKVCCHNCEVCGLANSVEHAPHPSNPLSPAGSTAAVAVPTPVLSSRASAGAGSEPVLPPSGMGASKAAGRQYSGPQGGGQYALGSTASRGQPPGSSAGAAAGGWAGGEVPSGGAGGTPGLVSGPGAGARSYHPPPLSVDVSTSGLGQGSRGGTGISASSPGLGLTAPLNPNPSPGSEAAGEGRSAVLERGTSSGLGGRTSSAGGAAPPAGTGTGASQARGGGSALHGARSIGGGSGCNGGGAAAGGLSVGAGVNGGVADSSQVLPLLKAGAQPNSSSHTSAFANAGTMLPLSTQPSPSVPHTSSYLSHQPSTHAHHSHHGCSNGHNGLLLGVAEEGAQDWVSVEDDFLSVMTVVTPCRSDKSTKGIIPAAHLADGLMYLVMVRRCNHAQYLRFLLTLSHCGLSDCCLPFVRVIPVTAVSVRPVGRESSWNVDGELLSDNTVSVQVQRALVDVFSRSIEMPR